jgi:starch synthase
MPAKRASRPSATSTTVKRKPRNAPGPRQSAPRPPARSVVMLASEAQPFAKTGGLADVLGALPPALARLGCNVAVILPKYHGVPSAAPIDTFTVTVGGYGHTVNIEEAPMADGARALLVDCPELFARDSLYGPNNTEYPDNPRRFALFARAALEHIAHDGRRPDIVHVHDWQAALAPVYLKTRYATDPVLAGLRSVLTIHNLAYQGNFPPDWLPRLDLGWDQFTIDRMEFWGRASFLKGGVNAADWITTVSPRYAEEIQTPTGGFGFDGIVRARRDRLTGILNGIDTREWDPMRDANLPQPFDINDLSGKKAAKAAVLAQYRLPTDDEALARPLVGLVSRMVDQKGLNLIAAIGNELPKIASFVVLGTGEPRYQDFWLRLAAAHPARIGVRIGFDESLAHLIEGGADMFLMPSQFEPCGLNQMYSLRYGTVPVVRAVGGLVDTVREGQTGFVVPEHTPASLLSTLQRAVTAFADPMGWRALQAAGMALDHSWDRSAAEYVKIYDRLGLGA